MGAEHGHKYVIKAADGSDKVVTVDALGGVSVTQVQPALVEDPHRDDVTEQPTAPDNLSSLIIRGEPRTLPKINGTQSWITPEGQLRVSPIPVIKTHKIKPL